MPDNEELTLFALYQGGLVFGFAIMVIVAIVFISDGWVHPALNRAVIVAGFCFIVAMIARYKYKRISE